MPGCEGRGPLQLQARTSRQESLLADGGPSLAPARFLRHSLPSIRCLRVDSSPHAQMDSGLRTSTCIVIPDLPRSDLSKLCHT